MMVILLVKLQMDPRLFVNVPQPENPLCSVAKPRAALQSRAQSQGSSGFCKAGLKTRGAGLLQLFPTPGWGGCRFVTC